MRERRRRLCLREVEPNLTSLCVRAKRRPWHDALVTRRSQMALVLSPCAGPRRIPPPHLEAGSFRVCSQAKGMPAGANRFHGISPLGILGLN